MKQKRAVYLPVFLCLVLLLTLFSGCGGEEASGTGLPIFSCAQMLRKRL